MLLLGPENYVLHRHHISAESTPFCFDVPLKAMFKTGRDVLLQTYRMQLKLLILQGRVGYNMREFALYGTSKIWH